MVQKPVSQIKFLLNMAHAWGLCLSLSRDKAGFFSQNVVILCPEVKSAVPVLPMFWRSEISTISLGNFKA